MKRLKILTQATADYFYREGIKILYRPKELFFRPEDSAQGIYYLEQGQALLYAMQADGQEQILGVWEAGAIFGKVGSVFAIKQTPITTQALTNCVVYRLSCERFQTLLQTQPSFFAAYMQQVSFNNVYVMNQVLILGERNIYLRIIAQLLLLADYYGDPSGQGSVLRLTLTQEQLANMICISREYLSKNLTLLKNKALIKIDQQGRMVIVDFDRLNNELGR